MKNLLIILTATAALNLPTLTLANDPDMPLALGMRQITQVMNLRNRKE